MSSAVVKSEDEDESLVSARRLGGKHLSADRIDSHQRICDLMQFEFPVLSLYSDGRRDWLYLWCDTNGYGTDRYLIFPTSRGELVKYLRRKASLREVLSEAETVFLLDTCPTTVRRKRNEDASKTIRRTLWTVMLDQVAEYMPAANSYFDETLTNEIDVTKQLEPEPFRVPIRGDWFGQDFQELFRSYERIYALYYATGKRFVTTINQGLSDVLHAPWTGGFSRVNLYTQLARHIPGIHSLKVRRMKFASPGDIFFDAVESVGDRIRTTTIMMLSSEEAIDEHVRLIRKALRGAGVNRKNLSDVSDRSLHLRDEHRKVLESECDSIAKALDSVHEFSVLRKHAPNLVVHSKAVLSLVVQLKHLAWMQHQRMLNFGDVATRSDPPEKQEAESKKYEDL